MSRIIWIASYPKSGNTWVRLFLTAYAHNTDSIDINGRNVVIGDSHDYPYRLVSPKRLEDLDIVDSIAIRPAALLHMLEQMPKPQRILMKTHWANMRVGDLPMIPRHITRGAVYIVRDPRDIVLSHAVHCDLSVDSIIERMSALVVGAWKDTQRYLRTPMFGWSHHVRSWLDGANIWPQVVVRYEDLLTDPVQEFSKIVELIDGEVDEARVQKAVHATRFSELKRQEAAHGYVEKQNGEWFFRRGESGAWKQGLTEEQARSIEDTNSGMMRAMGYLH